MQTWKQGHKKKMKTALKVAPLLINGKRIYCVIVIERGLKRNIAPYSIRPIPHNELIEMVQKELSNSLVHDTSADTSQEDINNAAVDPTTTEPTAKVLINYVLNNSDLSFIANNTENVNTEEPDAEVENNQNNINCNRNMTKNKIRLTESQLHNLIKECVRKTLQEGKIYLSAN